MNEYFTNWRKSSCSEPDGHCVEAGRAGDGTIGVRDTKLDRSPIIEISHTEWARLLDRIRRDT